MTDNDIIKALECCVNGEDCLNCPLQEQFADCKPMTGALDLINRQMDKNKAYRHYYDECLKDLKKANAEIERLEQNLKEAHIDIKEKQEEIESLRNDLAKEFVCFVGSPHKVDRCPFFDELEKERTEAIKEFAERLKGKLHLNGAVMGSNCAIVNDADIDNLVKEMAGE